MLTGVSWLNDGGVVVGRRIRPVVGIARLAALDRHAIESAGVGRVHDGRRGVRPDDCRSIGLVLERKRTGKRKLERCRTKGSSVLRRMCHGRRLAVVDGHGAFRPGTSCSMPKGFCRVRGGDPRGRKSSRPRRSAESRRLKSRKPDFGGKIDPPHVLPQPAHPHVVQPAAWPVVVPTFAAKQPAAFATLAATPSNPPASAGALAQHKLTKADARPSRSGCFASGRSVKSDNPANENPAEVKRFFATYHPREKSDRPTVRPSKKRAGLWTHNGYCAIMTDRLLFVATVASLGSLSTSRKVVEK